jgi:outer membrane protein assembly factor BamB
MICARAFTACFLALLLAAGATSAGRSADNASLSTATVGRLHLRWRVQLNDVSDSVPIFVKSGARSMLFLTTRNGTSYGIDAHSGTVVWKFVTHGPGITTSVPAADIDGTIVYVPGVDGCVHKLDAKTGAQLKSDGFPVRITRIPDSEKDASRLTIGNGYLYAVTSGYFGDAPPFVGHLVAIRLRDGSVHVFNALCAQDRALPTATSCSQSGSGIWSRAGAVVDPDPAMHGAVFVATGNGDFNANRGGHDYGDSVLAIAADGSHLLDSYTPSTYAELDSGDVDLGSTAPVMLPPQPHSRTPLMAVQGGKDAILRLLDRKHLGGVGGELQTVDTGNRIFSAPTVWQDDHARTWIYVGVPDGVQAYRLETDGGGKSRLVLAWTAHAGQTEEGTSAAIAGNVVFSAMDRALYAFDARTGRELWNSAQASAGGTIGVTHWESPLVAGNWVYCSDEDGRLSAYSLP